MSHYLDQKSGVVEIEPEKLSQYLDSIAGTEAAAQQNQGASLATLQELAEREGFEEKGLEL